MAVLEYQLRFLLVVRQLRVLRDLVVLLHYQGHQERHQQDGGQDLKQHKQDPASDGLDQVVDTGNIGVADTESHRENKGVSEVAQEGIFSFRDIGFL